MVSLNDGRYGSVPIDAVIDHKKVVDVEKLLRHGALHAEVRGLRAAADAPLQRTQVRTRGIERRERRHAKRVLLVPDGMADEPLDELDGRTPDGRGRAHADMDALARRGTLGLVRTVPEGMPPGSDVANLAGARLRPGGRVQRAEPARGRQHRGRPRSRRRRLSLQLRDDRRRRDEGPRRRVHQHRGEPPLRRGPCRPRWAAAPSSSTPA